MKNNSYQKFLQCLRLRFCPIFLCLSALISSCADSDNASLQHYLLTVKARPAKPIEPIPELKPLAKFIYPEKDSRRSPFKPRSTPSQPDKFAPNIKRQKQPLEYFPLDALKFVGILKQGRTIWALMKAPKGLIAKVTVGDYLGQNYGLIKSITPKEMHVDEAIRVGGQWEKRSIVINLSVPD